MYSWIKRFLTINIPLALFLTVVMVMPDHLMSLVSDRNQVVYEHWMYLVIFGFCSLLLLVRRPAVIFTVIGLFWITEIAHFCYMAYFGGVISASAILQFFTEFHDVFSASLGYSHYLYYAPLVVILPYAIGIIVFKYTDHMRSTIPYAWVVLFGVLSIVPFKIVMKPHDSVRYYPNPSYPSMANSYMDLSVLFFNHIPHLLFPGLYEKDQRHFLPVKVTRNEEPEKMTIVVIMTESVTYDHMGLYGYNRPTTPFLSSLKNQPDFVWKPGIAAGISTRVSFASFWNDVRDPRNQNRFMKKTTNLFRLARNNGFYNQLMSAQSSNLIRESGTEYIQEIYTEDTITPYKGERNDNSLLVMARELSLHDRNFIVFHTRTAHAPYKSVYEQNPEQAIYPEGGLDYRDMLVNTYDNAVHYTDHIIEGLVKTMADRVDGPLYIIITSDHGQLFGEDPAKTYGHGKLVPEVGHVPIIFYSVNGKRKWTDYMKNLMQPTHYQLANMMISMLGYSIDDRNSKDQIYYINGLGYHHGENGYIRVDKSGYPRHAIQYRVFPKS